MNYTYFLIRSENETGTPDRIAYQIEQVDSPESATRIVELDPTWVKLEAESKGGAEEFFIHGVGDAYELDWYKDTALFAGNGSATFYHLHRQEI